MYQLFVTWKDTKHSVTNSSTNDLCVPCSVSPLCAAISDCILVAIPHFLLLAMLPGLQLIIALPLESGGVLRDDECASVLESMGPTATLQLLTAPGRSRLEYLIARPLMRLLAVEMLPVGGRRNAPDRESGLHTIDSIVRMSWKRISNAGQQSGKAGPREGRIPGPQFRKHTYSNLRCLISLRKYLDFAQ